MKWWWPWSICIVLMFGCASMTTGAVGIPLDATGNAKTADTSPIVVRSRYLRELSSPHLPVFAISFENRASAWQTIDEIQFQTAAASDAGSIKIPLGQQLASWQQATFARQEIATANQETINELLWIGAYLALDIASKSKRRDVRIGSAIVSGAAAGAALHNHYSRRIEQAENPKPAPANHLLAGPMSLPPGSVLQRWILTYAPGHENGRTIPFVISYRLEGKRQERVLLRQDPSRGRHSRASLSDKLRGDF